MLEGYKLKNRNAFPPGGYFFIEKTGHKIVGNTFENLVFKVFQYRVANPSLGYTIDRFKIEREVEEFTCKRLNYDKNYCYWTKIELPKGNKGQRTCGACPKV